MPNRWRQRSAPRGRRQDHDHCQFVEPRRNVRCQPFLQVIQFCQHISLPCAVMFRPLYNTRSAILRRHWEMFLVWRDSKVKGGVERAKGRGRHEASPERAMESRRSHERSPDQGSLLREGGGGVGGLRRSRARIVEARSLSGQGVSPGVARRRPDIEMQGVHQAQRKEGHRHRMMDVVVGTKRYQVIRSGVGKLRREMDGVCHGLKYVSEHRNTGRANKDTQGQMHVRAPCATRGR